jgi:multimeric flavodoxin WrbA
MKSDNMSINVLAFNCSQKENNGNTARVLEPLLEGMSKAGANVELFYTNRLNIEKCRACTEDLNFISPGECLIVDDMKYIYPKLRSADLWVFASPNINADNNGALIKLLDRLEPLFDPFLGHNNGTKVPITNPAKGKVLLLSTDNEFERTVFQPLIQHLESVCGLFGRDFIGSILRPHAWTLQARDLFGKKVDEFLGSVRLAGEEIIKNGKVTPNTNGALNKDIVSRNAFVLELINN